MDKNERIKIEPRQVIIVRKDLNMSKGKMAAQVAHASLGCITNQMLKIHNKGDIYLSINIDEYNPLYLWLQGRFTKIILEVKSEAKLLEVYTKAKILGINCCLIKDAGFTEFEEPTHTCVGLGPDFDKNLKEITKRLQIFKG